MSHFIKQAWSWPLRPAVVDFQGEAIVQALRYDLHIFNASLYLKALSLIISYGKNYPIHASYIFQVQDPIIFRKRKCHVGKLTELLSALHLYPFSGRKSSISLDKNNLREAHLEGFNLRRVHLMEAKMEGAFLMGANLVETSLNKAHLEGADLREAHMKKAVLIGAWLEGADLHKADLEGAFLNEAHLENADLRGANLKGANLRKAHLEGADLRGANLEGADLHEATLGGKLVSDDRFSRVQQWNSSFPRVLLPADLRGVFLDSSTRLGDAVLGNTQYGFVSLADIHWNDANLSGVRWTLVTMLGDELEARQWKQRGYDRKTYVDVMHQAVRANRQLAAVLEDQGIHEGADHFFYRAQVLQREVLWLQLLLQLLVFWGKIQETGIWKLLLRVGQRLQKTGVWKLLVRVGKEIRVLGTWLVVRVEKRIRELGAWLQKTWVWKLLVKVGKAIHWLGAWLLKFAGFLFSLLLGLLAGYGYRPGRSVFWYLFVVFGFAAIYHVFYGLSELDALFLSLTSFHGRGFFPGPTNKAHLSAAELFAAIEAVIGLFIELSFVTAFTGRFLRK